jgi:hypothetical protein
LTFLQDPIKIAAGVDTVPAGQAGPTIRARPDIGSFAADARPEGDRMRCTSEVGWRCCLTLFLSSLLTGGAAVGQAFVNLDFEETNVIDLGGDVPTLVVQSVPGWSFSTFDPPGLQPHIGLAPQQYLANDLVDPNFGVPPLEGHFSVFMATEVDCIHNSCDSPETTPPPSAPFITQTGLVPAGTRTIRMLASDPRPYVLPNEAQQPTAWFVSLDGVEIPMTELEPGLFSGDAAAFAGSVAELRIGLNADYVAIGTSDGSDSFPLYSVGTFDAVEFSPVPEPATGWFMAIGLAAVAARRGCRANC